jgi:hypothetical protein
MAISRRLLAIIGRRNPAIYDVIPRGPLGLFTHVTLNPQPLPPAVLGAAVAAEFAHLAWQADRMKVDPGQAFAELDDWCPTGRAKLKLPPWWPPLPEPDPEPHPDWTIDFHLGFAARLAAVADSLEGTQLGESLEKAINRSLEAIEYADRATRA